MARTKESELLTLPGKATGTSLELPPRLTYEECLTIGKKLWLMRNFIKFAFGDFLLYVEKNHGDKYIQAAAEIGLGSEEAPVLRYVSSNVAPNNRDASLSWSHHKEVAKLEPKKQVQWLNKAAKERWTVKTLCEQLEGEGLRKKRSRAEQSVSLLDRVVPIDRESVAAASKYESERIKEQSDKNSAHVVVELTCKCCGGSSGVEPVDLCKYCIAETDRLVGYITRKENGDG